MGKIYLFYGEEKFELNNKVQKIKKEFSHLETGLNYFIVNKDNINELENITQGVSFFGSEKLIIVKDTNLKFNLNYITNLDDSIVIIIEDSVDKRLTEYKLLCKIAECTEFKSLNDEQMVKYIIDTLRLYNVSISREIAEYMQSVCGNDKTNNINELQKLVIYLGNEKIVTKEIIDKILVKTLNAKIFDVLDLIVNKNKEAAIIMLCELLNQKESIIKIYIMLYKQVKQMYIIKYLQENKKGCDIADILKIHPFVLKNLSKVCGKYSTKDLEKIINLFDEYDEKTKNGEMDFEIGLKKIICSM